MSPLNLPSDIDAAPPGRMIQAASMRLIAVALAILMGLLIPLTALHAAPKADPNDVQTAWRLLDYVAVDYNGAVKGGRQPSGGGARPGRRPGQRRQPRAAADAGPDWPTL